MNDTSLKYKITGTGDPVVLLSGLSLDPGIWDEVVKELEPNYKIINVDNRDAFLKAPCTIKTVSNHVGQLIKKQKLSKVTLVGHSMGGYIAGQLAADFPELVKRLILVATSGQGDPKTLGMTKRAAEALARVKGTKKEITRQNIEASVARSYLKTKKERLNAFINERIANASSGRVITAQRKTAFTFDGTQDLKNIVCEAVIVHGDSDEIISLSVAKKLQKLINNSKLVVLKNVGHLPMLEAPQRLAKIITE